MIELNKRLVEVDIILDHLSKSDYEKIPKKLIETIKKNKDNKYTWEYDETKELKKQNLNIDTIAILSYINMQFLLNEEQKNYMKQIYNKNEQELEKEKINKYNSNEIFKKSNNNKDTSMIVVEKEKWYNKILKKIKKILKR